MGMAVLFWNRPLTVAYFQSTLSETTEFHSKSLTYGLTVQSRLIDYLIVVSFGPL